MESHGGRLPETPRGPRGAALPLDVREAHLVGGQNPPPTPRRPSHPARVHSRPPMALVTPPPPQTCVLQPVASTGPMRPPSVARSGSRVSGNLRRNMSDFAPVTIGEVRSDFSTVASSGGRLEHAVAPSPVLNGRVHSLSTSRLQNTYQFSNSPSNSRSRVASASASGDTVSLTLPRPETERTANEYVEAPLRPGLSLIEPKLEATTHRTLRTNVNSDVTQRDSSNFAMVTLPALPVSTPGRLVRQPRGKQERSSQRGEKVVTTQPSATFTKEARHSRACVRSDDLIICSECKRCRCESCRTPKPLPSRWLCGNVCHCSAEAIVDYATCLCCAKAFFYHFSNEESKECADDPCGCGPERLCARWSCLGLTSLVLPCLFCYWPCRGLVQLCQACHDSCSRRGCRCQRLYPQPAPLTSEKRLLDSPE